VLYSSCIILAPRYPSNPPRAPNESLRSSYTGLCRNTPHHAPARGSGSSYLQKLVYMRSSSEGRARQRRDELGGRGADRRIVVLDFLDVSDLPIDLILKGCLGAGSSFLKWFLEALAPRTSASGVEETRQHHRSGRGRCGEKQPTSSPLRRAPKEALGPRQATNRQECCLAAHQIPRGRV
jgi:hypothetical protein